MSIVVDSQNEVDECQEFQTIQESLGGDLVPPFQHDDAVSRSLAATTRQQSRDILMQISHSVELIVAS